MGKEKLTVSEDTQRFIECLDCLNKLWVNVYDAVIASYGKEQVEGIINEGFNEAHGNLYNVVMGFVSSSIKESLFDINYTEI